MKQILFSVFVLFGVALSAQEPVTMSDTSSSQPYYSTWTPFQLGLFPGVPSYVNGSRVIGIKTGWPISGGAKSVVDGFESSWIYSGTNYVNGLQASILMDISQQVRGFAPAIGLNINTQSFVGFQAACVFNMAGDVTGFQAGGLDIANSVNGCQAGVLGCITREMNGFQTGLFAVAKKLDGVQFSAVNVAGESDTCFQMGVVNVATKERGVQFGLVNVIKDGWVPFLPIFNISLR